MSLVYELFISAQYIIVKFIQSHIVCLQLNINVNIFRFISTQLVYNSNFRAPNFNEEYLWKIYV